MRGGGGVGVSEKREGRGLGGRRGKKGERMQTTLR